MSNFFDRTIAVGLLAVLVLTALAHGAVEPWSVGLFEMLLVGLLALWAVKAVVDKQLNVTIPTVTLPMLALLALGVVQSIAWTNNLGQRAGLSLDIDATRASVLVLGFLILFFVMAVNFFGTHERMLLAANVLTFFGVILAAFSLIQHFNLNSEFIGPFVNRAHFAGCMAMLAPIPLGLILAGVRHEARILYGFAAALMGTAAIGSFSRGGAVSLVLALGFMALVYSRLHGGHRNSSRAAKAAPIALAGGAMLAGLFWVGAAPVVDRFGDSIDQFVERGTADVRRAEIWQGTAGMIHEFPLMGAGLGAFTTVYPTYTVEDTGLLMTYVHNDYLQVLADSGALGGLIALWFLIITVTTLSRAIQSSEPVTAGLSLAAATGMFAIAVHSISDTQLQIPSNALLFLFLLAIVSTVDQPTGIDGMWNEAPEGPAPARRCG